MRKKSNVGEGIFKMQKLIKHHDANCHISIFLNEILVIIIACLSNMVAFAEADF